MTLRNSTRLVVNILLVQVFIFSFACTAFASYQVSDINFVPGEDGFTVNVVGSAPPTYTVYELFGPMRVVVDIADASFDSRVTLPQSVNQDPVSKITGKILADKEPAIAKIEIFLTDDRTYSVNRKDNDIQIVFAQEEKKEETESQESAVIQKEPVVEKKVAGIIVKKDEREDAYSEVQPEPSDLAGRPHVDPVSDLLQSMTAPVGERDRRRKGSAMEQDQFAAAGFKKQKISVDFYKIDLHNVFRLFGEISDSNMIIDQGVSGVLTLALNEVPWDFALDIILNLKDLQKEERYNTIVISQKSKAFKWPEEPEKDLEIKAPSADITIAIEQRLEMPTGMLEAKKLMFRAQKFEKENNFNPALQLYEQAFLKWPENGELARRIASLCLVELGMNAKALHFAKAALKIDAKDDDAALQAAVAAANMRQNKARDYFMQATSVGHPSQEALVSFASYEEQNGEFESALTLLERHADMYGDSLDTMLAKARIYDNNGQQEKAVAEYKTILYSGFELDADLKRYINGRVLVD